MLAAIDAARRYVFIEMYLVASGAVATRFIEALLRARQRGVAAYLLFDDFGTLGLNASDRQRLTDAGVVLRFYNPLHVRKWLRNLLRDHRKLLLADGEVAFVGGTGLADEFDPVERPQDRWRETMIEVRGPVVADWHDLFVEVGRDCEVIGDAAVTPVPRRLSHGQRGRVVPSGRLGLQHVTRSVISRVRTAQRRIWIATAYFVPSRKLRRALWRAASRGVDVRVLVPGPRTDHPTIRYAGRRHYSRLLRHGVRILEYQPRFLHTKLILVDDWSSIGSSNLDRWNLRWNLEANQEIADVTFAGSVADMLHADFTEAAEIQLTRWRRRGLRARLLEWYGGFVDRVLQRVGD